ncbi:GH13742 [Drosophila grimshawi]|uniref:GH13742 n=1 Tax=Drosophila grimshawi TaxID=7222 RepID=B4JQR4_DROGR|nr:GH13742 [Drosophila grimshawi]
MINRRQRLEFALSILPYDFKSVQLSRAQNQVEDIIARLRTDDTSAEEESDEEKTRTQQQKNAKGFAEQTMRHIEQSEGIVCPRPKNMLSTLATLTLAAEKLLKTQCKVDDESFEENEEFVDRKELMENSIQALNEARLKMLQRWERSKRKALDLLTIEIEKVQAMDQDHAQKAAHFQMFRDGADEHNTSTPKTNDDDDDDDEEKENEKENINELDDDDEEYVPSGAESCNKRKRQKKFVTSTPYPILKCPHFEFDHDANSSMITIGPNGTQISRACLTGINWSMSGPSITRKLMCEIFDRATLAFHTLSGKPSPAFKDCARPSKQQLDPLKVSDLVYLMTNSLQMTPREVRTAITTKCADENKMLRTRLQRDPRKTI